MQQNTNDEERRAARDGSLRVSAGTKWSPSHPRVADVAEWVMITGMDEPRLRRTAELLAQQLRDLRPKRRQLHSQQAKDSRKGRLTTDQRVTVLGKTAGRCHLCGGDIVARWQADHVLAHAGGGKHDIDNYLAAHALCNKYRRHYSPEEFQWVLKIGVWARKQMEANSGPGKEMLRRFFAYDRGTCAETGSFRRPHITLEARHRGGRRVAT